MSDIEHALTAVATVAAKHGTYLSKVIGSIPEDALGLAVGDWLKEKRRLNLAKLKDSVDKQISDLRQSRISDPSPSSLLPILRAAADESRETLQSMWANLLANLLTDGGKRVRRLFFDILERLDPLDAKVLDFLWSEVRYGTTATGSAVTENKKKQLSKLLGDIGINQTDLRVSLEALRSHNLINTSEWTDQIGLTYLGHAFLVACRPVPEDPNAHPV